MAAEVVRGALFTVSLEVLVKRIPSILDFVRRKKVDADPLMKLRFNLLSIKRLLNDAELKQLADENVRRWLKDVGDAVHDAEDLVDEINTEALRCEIEEPGRSTGSRLSLFQVREPFSARLNFRDVETRIQKILGTLEYILNEKDKLGLKEDDVAGKAYRHPRGPSETTLVKGSDVYGRDADKKAITEMLLSDDDKVGGGRKIPVIPIVGMGGVGKTTLAQVVYRDIERDFNFKVWITVSEGFDVFTVTKRIYEQVPSSKPKRTFQETFQLQRELEENLEGKKFLLVLDDVWSKDYRKWDAFKTPLGSAVRGSRILVTTRDGEIASMMAGVQNQSYQLGQISAEHGWQLFAKHAFGDRVPSADLEEIGRAIVNKCQGLPLAIKSLAGLCSRTHDSSEWENILNSHIWDLPLEKGCNILPALWSSYYYLPPHLKRCFAYCSVFPKDYKIAKEQLIWLWMAEDLLQPQNTKSLEEVGEEYIKDLASRSFFHVDEYDRFITMHDLVNDLAKFISGDSCLRLDDMNYRDSLMRRTRHFSGLIQKAQDIKKFKDVTKSKVLRTLLEFEGNCFVKEYYLIQPEELQSMQYLRVFSPSRRRFAYEEPLGTQLLDSIGRLKLLRYLDISHTGIREIPHSICTLYNLQTLLLKSCFALTGLPDSIGNLRKLRHLDLSYCTYCEQIPETLCDLHELRTLRLAGCSKLSRLPTNIKTVTSLRHLSISRTSIKEMPAQMSNLKNLQKLDEFVVCKGSGANIEELGPLQHLRGSLRIKNLEHIVDVNDVLKANLKDKKRITQLSLEWGRNSDTDESCNAKEALDGLKPHTNLELLNIFHYRGTSLSRWVGDDSFSRIKTVRLIQCRNCCVLPPLGQLPSLENLQIGGLDMVEKIGDEFYGNSKVAGSCSSETRLLPFESLKDLTFHDMPRWKEWWLMKMEGNKEVGKGSVFSNVKQFKLLSCPKLDGACLPDYLPSLEKLYISFASLSRCQYPSLDSLRIFECDEMESFPQGRLPSNIRTIQIEGCPKLVSLLEEGWPSNLNTLELIRCDGLFQHDTQWNLRTLSSLTSLTIANMEVLNPDSFLGEQQGQLPTSLTSFHLSRLQNIKSLNGTVFQQLTSLQHLSISSCSLQGLPEQGLPSTLLSLQLWSLQSFEYLDGFRHLTSLQKLFIEDCKKLQCLPEEGLPATLSLLEISLCPLLTPRCQRGTGEDWSKIQHISLIRIDNEDI